MGNTFLGLHSLTDLLSYWKLNQLLKGKIMKILGISGSSRKNEVSSTYRLVKTVLEATGCEYDLISFRGKTIKGCTGCLGCVETNTCVQKDDMTELRDKIVDADAYVIGAPNYFSGPNATTHAFLERLYQFRHKEASILWGKLAVAIGIGGFDGKVVADRIEDFMGYSLIETIAKISGQGATCCFSCGYGETCKVGGIYLTHGQGFKITEETTPDISKQPEVIEQAKKAGALLTKTLKTQTREEVRIKMTNKILEN